MRSISEAQAQAKQRRQLQGQRQAHLRELAEIIADDFQRTVGADKLVARDLERTQAVLSRLAESYGRGAVHAFVTVNAGNRDRWSKTVEYALAGHWRA